MLDLDALLAAADDIGRETMDAPFPDGKHPMFPTQTQYPRGIPGDLGERETGETVFRGGWGVAQQKPTDTPSFPAPLKSGLPRPEPAQCTNPVSLVSHERESQCQCGPAGNFCGKQACFHPFPSFPVNHLDREALEERAAIMEYDGGMTRTDAEAASGLASTGPSRDLPTRVIRTAVNR